MLLCFSSVKNCYLCLSEIFANSPKLVRRSILSGVCFLEAVTLAGLLLPRITRDIQILTLRLSSEGEGGGMVRKQKLTEEKVKTICYSAFDNHFGYKVTVFCLLILCSLPPSPLSVADSFLLAMI